MASIRKITNTPTLVSITKTRRIRADNLPISVAQSIDTLPERRQPSDRPAPEDQTPDGFEDALTEASIETVLSASRPIIDRLDDQQNVAETLKPEQPDHQDRSMQANEAYRTLRQPDAEKTPVGRA